MTSPVRQGTLEDLAEIAKLHAECFDDPWSIDFLGSVLAQPGAFTAIATEQGAPVGFVIARAYAGEGEILSLGVRPASRRRLLGTFLVQSAIERARLVGATEVFLEVAVENTVARKLYGSLGFGEVGARRAYYRAGSGLAADALVLRHSA